MPDIIWGPVVVGIIVFRLLAKHVCNFSLLEERVSGQDHNKVKKGRGQVTIASQIPSSALPDSIGIEDASLEQARIVETVTLPEIPDRTSYPGVEVCFTPEQYEGYIFLARLGELGGDPLARSVFAPPGTTDLW